MIRNKKTIINSKSANSKLALDLNKMDLKSFSPISGIFPHATSKNYFNKSFNSLD